MKGWLFNICDGCGYVGNWGVGEGGVGLETRSIVEDVGPHANARYATANFQISKWYQITGVRNSNIIYLYVDGILQATTSEPSPANLSNNIDLRIGSLSPTSPQFFNGTIDELKIYNRALSAEEIVAEYKKYAPPTDSDGDGLDDEKELSLGLDPNSVDTDSDNIGDFEEYALLSTYAPTFQYAPGLIYTEFYPQPVSTFLNHSDLYNFSGSIEATGPFNEEQISVYGKNYFLDFGEEELYGSRPHNIYKTVYDQLRPEYGSALYMRATTSTYNGEVYLVLQYWHHYLYNFFWNKHEGDWEMIEIILNNTTREPVYAAYSQHIDSFYRNGGEIKPWADVSKDNTHPIVYVALGSHASYFSADNFLLLGWVDILSDLTSTFGRTIEYDDFNHTIILRDDVNPTTQKWMLYEGRWGHVNTNDTDILGNNGPTGPAQKEEKWNSPAEWGLKYLSRTILLERNIATLNRGILTVKDDLGRIVTFLNNEIINEIPLAEVVSVTRPFYILHGTDSHMMSMSLKAHAMPTKYTYLIEANDTYEFELYLTNETEAMHIMLYNTSAETGTKDTIWLEGNKIYMNTGDALKSLDVVLEYMTDAGEINATLEGIEFQADETLVIEILDWTKVNETGNVLVDAIKKKCRLKDEGCIKIISKTNPITGLLLKIFGPGDKELLKWNTRSGKTIKK